MTLDVSGIDPTEETLEERLRSEVGKLQKIADDRTTQLECEREQNLLHRRKVVETLQKFQAHRQQAKDLQRALNMKVEAHNREAAEMQARTEEMLAEVGAQVEQTLIAQHNKEFDELKSR